MNCLVEALLLSNGLRCCSLLHSAGGEKEGGVDPFASPNHYYCLLVQHFHPL
jgi:hypothetical protein